jgi:hypothetical protein
MAFVSSSGGEDVETPVQTISLRTGGDSVTQLLNSSACVVACTTWTHYRLIETLGAETPGGATRPMFDLICIDEASQMMVGQGLMALAGLAPNGRVVVAGDHLQLQPVSAVFDYEAGGRKLGGSLYSFLRSAGVPEAPLQHTWRMNEPLTAFPRVEYYENALDPVPSRASTRLALRNDWEQGLGSWERAVLDPEYPVVVLLHRGPTTGTTSQLEARLVTQLTESFHDRMLPQEGDTRLDPDFFWRERLAIITPHRAQNALIRRYLRSKAYGANPVVETVERVQGQERDAVIVGYTVGDPEFAQAEAEFLFARERLNVATTRARRKLVLVINRHLLDILPVDEESVDAVETLRRFVFECRFAGQFDYPDPQGRSTRIEFLYRGFSDSPVLDDLRASERDVEPLPVLTQRLKDLAEAIQVVAQRNREYRNAPLFAVEKELGRAVPFAEYVTLLRHGLIRLQQRFGQSMFWVAEPVEPPEPPLTLSPVLARSRITTVMRQLRRGDEWLSSERSLRPCFVWVDEQEHDLLRPMLDGLAAKGEIEARETPAGLEVRLPASERGELIEELPELPTLQHDDFVVLNYLERIEAGRINFGILESWVRLADLFAAAELRGIRLSETLTRLELHSYVLIAEGRVRTRMAELAREIRYVKQRFADGDAQQRPYLVRNLKLELRDRNKPARNHPLQPLLDDLANSFQNRELVPQAIAPLGPMLRTLWRSKAGQDVELAGFQERGLRQLLASWLDPRQGDAFVITAETGTGKTEAAFLPVLAGMGYEALNQRRGAKAIFVYPRILLAFNQAQRFARYMAAYAAAGGPLLRMAVQATGGLRRADERGDLEPPWKRLSSTSTNFPLFACPGCGKELHLDRMANLPNSERLHCTGCLWEYAGWVADLPQLKNQPPDLLVIVTESLHQWQARRDLVGIFGDQPNIWQPPRVVLADEVHLYSLTHGAQVGFTLRRLLVRAQQNEPERRPLAIGMSATLGDPRRIWSELCGRPTVIEIGTEDSEREPNPIGREYFYFVQPEVESRGKDVAGASTTIQSLMVLAHGMRRRRGEGGYRGLVFLDSIDKVRRLHSDYKDAEDHLHLARFRVHQYNRFDAQGDPVTGCCCTPLSCSRFRDGECWYFAANDTRQIGAKGRYDPTRPLAVAPYPVTSQNRDSDKILRENDLLFATSTLEVGYDDPELALVYQHYAPANLASFVQRKGRGGRGADDRPITGITLSPYSPRDSWYFLRPAEMVSPRDFNIPLNMQNFFVRRGQVLAAIADMAARTMARRQSAFMDTEGRVWKPSFKLETDRFVRSVFGDTVYADLGFNGIEDLWLSARNRVVNFDPNNPWVWRESMPEIPTLLFESVNLPVLDVLPAQEVVNGQPRILKENIALVFATVAPGNPTRRYSPFRFHWRPPAPGLRVWLDPADYRFAVWEELPLGSPERCLKELPDSAVRSFPASASGPVVCSRLCRPAQIRLEVAAEVSRRSPWRVDLVDQRVLSPRETVQNPTVSVHMKSRASLRGAAVVEADHSIARPLDIGPAELGQWVAYLGSSTATDKTGLSVSMLYWGADASIRTDDRKPDFIEMAQLFRHPSDNCLLFHGYRIETEGIQLRLSPDVVNRFVEQYCTACPKSRERFLRGQFLQYLLQSRSLADGLSVFEAQRLGELLQAAAGESALRQELNAVVKWWDRDRFSNILQGAYNDVLTFHPLLTDRRVARLQERIADTPQLQNVIRSSLVDVKSDALFRRYLRSILIHSLAVRLYQQFVILGRGDEQRILAHAKLPIEFHECEDDIITVFENGGHGDGTTRLFLESLSRLGETWRAGALGDCPNAIEDAAIDRLMSNLDRCTDFRRRILTDPEELCGIGQEIGLPASATDSLGSISRVLTGREWFGGEPFDFFDIHFEVRGVRIESEQRLERPAQLWELVTRAVKSARQSDSATPVLARLLKAYELIPDASMEESLSAEARLAETVMRFSGRLCIDGCMACLHSGAGVVPSGLETASLSRHIVSEFGKFVFGESNS